jgi:hypothetical protein
MPWTLQISCHEAFDSAAMALEIVGAKVASRTAAIAIQLAALVFTFANMTWESIAASY